ncbi:MAG: 50S ribosomal protein L30 [Deltaproteobacteria bacterium]|nr:50S ribosomal protein L30 [Deltaproteobacteria bacterium]
MMAQVKITLRQRPSTEKQKVTLKGLGLKKIDSTRILNDTAAIRGMIGKVSHLVCVQEVR